jgi:hypothetical protein
MNAASAGGYLGGAANEATPCNFARANASLTIEIATGQDLAPYLAKCGSQAFPLKAIGNEAFACSMANGERVIGRVRDQIFVVTIVTDEAPAALREKARKAAEQVAGNLY